MNLVSSKAIMMKRCSLDSFSWLSIILSCRVITVNNLPLLHIFVKWRSASSRQDDCQYQLNAMILALAIRAMNTLAQSPPGSDPAERLRRYKAGRVIEFLSVCPEFEDLQENNFLEMNFTDLAEFFVMQLGYESLEECYERFVYREPYGLASLNAEIERLRLAAVAGRFGRSPPKKCSRAFPG